MSFKYVSPFLALSLCCCGQTPVEVGPVRNLMFDPEGARIIEERVGRDGIVCGLINGKNRFGAYTGYRPFSIVGGRAVIYDLDTRIIYEGWARDYQHNCHAETVRSFARRFHFETVAERENRETSELDAYAAETDVRIAKAQADLLRAQ